MTSFSSHKQPVRQDLVRLECVYKSYRTPGFSRTRIFQGLSLTLPAGRNIAVLGGNGAGKSTLLRLISGIENPDRGSVSVMGRPSPPKGLSGGVLPILTGNDNARFICRISGLHGEGMSDRLAYIRDLADLGVHFERPVHTYSSGMRARLNFAINMAFEYDLYLFDELGAVGDKNYRERASALIEERKKTASFLIVSHAMDQIRRDCDAGLYLENGRADYFDSLEDAIDRYLTARKAPAGRAA